MTSPKWLIRELILQFSPTPVSLWFAVLGGGGRVVKPRLLHTTQALCHTLGSLCQPYPFVVLLDVGKA